MDYPSDQDSAKARKVRRCALLARSTCRPEMAMGWTCRAFGPARMGLESDDVER